MKTAAEHLRKKNTLQVIFLENLKESEKPCADGPFEGFGGPGFSGCAGIDVCFFRFIHSGIWGYFHDSEKSLERGRKRANIVYSK